jgi:isoamylase
MKIRPGHAYPLGATYDGAGVNFALFSEVAERVELCLFDADGNESRADLPEVTSYCWHGYVPGLHPGQQYGFRVHGPWAPGDGHRCNPQKLLLDPYAKAVTGAVRWNEAVFGHRLEALDERDDRDSAPFVPRSLVVNPFFDWADDRQPKTPANLSVIYEAHVRGLTKIHPEVPPELRGTYAGLAHPAVIDHLRHLGITAIELMPVHHFVHDWHLGQKGLSNYWGYNSIAYLAPHSEYASQGPLGAVQEFKQMVRALHAAGIEVILDVVYNHTAEGNHQGPTLSLKGIDNAAYYRLANDRRYYMDYTGTGNSLSMRHPQVLQLVMDSLRYWVLEMHVDGFRFDLAATLARGLHEVDRLSAFFDLIHQDPVVGQVKLIAEPWDVGEGGYQVGNFPPQWAEWNGKYRDCVRDFWRGTDQALGEFAHRLSGSPDLYETTGRRPFASINFVTAHDGFTLHDLVSYNDKHNEANGEENRDGDGHNRSWNCGAEGDTDDPEVNALRARQKRNFLATLLVSQGIPMLVAGDELGRTQRGNNNAYCQDTPISWVDWESADRELIETTAGLIALRRTHPVFRRRRFFLGRSIHGHSVTDIGWYRPDGQAMSDDDWNVGFAKSLGVYLNGAELGGNDELGEPLADDSFFLAFNAHYEPVPFTIPASLGGAWTKLFDTFEAPLVPGAPVGAVPASIPKGERERLRELHRYAILDTASEPVFDDVARLAAQICGTPIALVSFVDAERQWFKARVGTDVVETPRETSFCAHAILGARVMEVADTLEDQRFAHNPYVVGPPHIRYYAGAPLVTPSGHAIGALCVVDKKPRRLTEQQLSGLELLARQVVGQLEMRRAMRELLGDIGVQMSGEHPHPLRLPLGPAGGLWRAGDSLPVQARSLVILMKSA